MVKEEKIKLFNEVLKKESEAINLAIKNIKEEDVLKASEIIFNCQGKVLVIALGKSGYIGEKISASFSSMGIPSFFIHATELFHGDFGRIENNDVCLLFSHSGETNEVVEAAKLLKKRGNELISITKTSQSSLAKLSDVSINYLIEEESDHINMAPTSSSTVTLAIGDALMVLVSKMKKYTKEDFVKNHPGGSLGKTKV